MLPYPFLMLVLPLFGVGLVACSAWMGVEAVRRTALTNSLLTLGLAAMMVVQYDPGARRADGTAVTRQMRSQIRWLAAEGSSGQVAGPDVRLSVGVDGANLWFLALTAALTVAAVVATDDRGLRTPATHYGMLLAWESALVGLYAAFDAALFSLCLLGNAILAGLMLGGWGSREGRRVSWHAAAFPSLGAVLVATALASLVTSQWWMVRSAVGPEKGTTIQPTFDIPSLATWIPYLAGHRTAPQAYWEAAGPRLCGLLALGLWICSPLPPFHSAWREALRAASPGVRLLYGGTWGTAALYGVLRFAPTIDSALPQFHHIGTTFAMGGAAWLGLLAGTCESRSDRIRLVTLSHFAQAVAGALSGVPMARAASVVLAVGASLGQSSLILQPRSLAASCGLAGLPGLGVFSGLWLLWRGLLGSEAPGRAGTIDVAIGVAAALFALGAWLPRESTSSPKELLDAPPPGGDVSERVTETGRALVFAALMLAFLLAGLAPRLIVDRIAPTISAKPDDQ